MSMQYQKVVLSVLLFAGSFCLFTSEAQAALLRKVSNNLGLVGYWSFEDGKGSTITDFSGKGNTGTLTNMDPATDWVAGKRGKALDFDGSNDHVVIGGPSSIYGMTTDLSVFAWIKTTDTAWEAFSGGNADDGGWGLSSFSSIGGTGQLTPLTGGTWRTSGHSNVSDGEWHHVGYTLSSDSGGTLQFYKDGVADGSAITSAGAHSNVGAAIRMGSENNAGSFPFTGQMDEARVYSRAITAAEVAALYTDTKRSVSNQASQNSLITSGLVGFWTFNEGELNSTTSTDRIGGKNGTLNGGPVAVAGKVGQALQFDASNDYVLTGSVPSGLTGDVAITMTAWVRPHVISTAMIVGNLRGAYKFFGMMLNLAGNGSVGLEGGSCGAETAANVLVANQWQHIVIAKSPGAIVDTTKIYVNGILYPVSAGPYGTCTPSFGGTIFEIGGGWDSATEYLFDGDIDEVRLYNRALSESEVQALYHGGKSKIKEEQNSFLTSGLVAFWSFNGTDSTATTTRDISGTGNTLYLQGTAQFGLGKVGQGLQITGVNAASHASTSASVLDPSTTDLTAAAWFKPFKLDSTNDVILSQEAGSGQGRNWLFVAATTSKLGSTIGGVIMNSTSTIQLNQWHHGAVTLSGTTRRLYLNGVLENSTTTTAEAANGVFAVGKGVIAGHNQNFPGIIDEVRIYNRALSDSEILQLYQKVK